MSAFRLLARAAPRANSQFATKQLPRQMRFLSSTSLRQPNFSGMKYLRPMGIESFGAIGSRLFSMSRSLRDTDEELVLKLTQEHQVEQDLNDGPNSRSDAMKKALDAFLEESGYSIEDTPGNSEVVLTRKFDTETVKITFTIEDLKQVYDEEDAYDEELEPEAVESQTPEEQAESEEEESPYSQPFTAKLSINIIKDGKPGSLVIEALAQNNQIEVSDMFYFRDAKLADPKTLEEARERDAVYPGPAFANLDEELQGLVEAFVAERGVNEAMATFVADYIDWKEQNEYVRWLEDVKDFCS